MGGWRGLAWLLPALLLMELCWLLVEHATFSRHRPFQALFALAFVGYGCSLLLMKLSMIALNLGVVALLVALLRRAGLAPALAAIYAWNPRTVFQVGFSGHNEPLMLLCLLGALLLAAQRRLLLAAWALALATLAKLVPLLALPVVLRHWGWRAALVYCSSPGARSSRSSTTLRLPRAGAWPISSSMRCPLL